MHSKNFKYGRASVKLIYMGPGLYALSNLYSQNRGHGEATGVLEEAVHYADEHSSLIRLIVQQYGYSDQKAMGNVPLEKFYEKFGFVVDSREGRMTSMIRFPRKNYKSSNEKKLP